MPFGGARSPTRSRTAASYVKRRPDAVAATVDRFLHPPAPGTPKKRVGKPKATGLIDTRALGGGRGAPGQARHRHAPVLPALGPTAASYAEPQPRVYKLHGKPAYRLSVKVTGDDKVGAYYGIQGMRWKDAPILAAPHKDVVVDRRTFSVYTDGSKTAMVAWKTPNAVYYVHNTLDPRPHAGPDARDRRAAWSSWRRR